MTHPTRPDDGDSHQHDTDWFGFPVRKGADLRPVPPTPCPYCGTTFTSGGTFRAHLTAEHGVRAARTRSTPAASDRVRRWVQSLAYLPFWFVVPLNIGITTLLAVAWWDDFALFSAGDQTGVLKAWIVRLSLLPVVCYLTARVATVGRR